MKRKGNQKGFTIVELLAVTAVLAVISTIAVAGISVVFRNMQNNYNKTQMDLIIISGKDYYSVNRKDLPKDIGSSNQVGISKLIEEGYLDPVYDYHKKKCEMKDPEDNYVKVTLSSKGDYHYSVNLSCENSNMQLKVDKTPPTIEIGGKDIYGEKDKKDPIPVKVKDDESDICFVEYTVLQGEVEKKKAVLSKSVEKIVTGSISVSELADGEYTIVVEATDCSGNKSKKEKEIIVDTTAPVVGKIEYRKENEKGEVVYARGSKDKDIVWYPTNIFATLKSLGEDNGSGIDYSEFDIVRDDKSYLKKQQGNVTLTKPGVYEITLRTYDKAGNMSSLREYINIDNTPIGLTYKKEFQYIYDTDEYKKAKITDLYKITSTHRSGIESICRYQGKEIVDISSMLKEPGNYDVECSFKTGSGIEKKMVIALAIIVPEHEFPYKDEIQEYPIYVTGYYNVEAWGAKGGGNGGNGGYISGKIKLTAGDTLIVKTGNIGGGGKGYNGGNGGRSTTFMINGQYILIAGGGGGGAGGGAGGAGNGSGGASGGQGAQAGDRGTNGSGGGNSGTSRYFDQNRDCHDEEDEQCDTCEEEVRVEECCSTSTDHCWDSCSTDWITSTYPCNCSYETITVCEGEWVSISSNPGSGGASTIGMGGAILSKEDGIETGNGHGKITFMYVNEPSGGNQ